MKIIKKLTVLLASVVMAAGLMACDTVYTDVSSMVSANRGEELKGTLVNISDDSYQVVSVKDTEETQPEDNKEEKESEESKEEKIEETKEEKDSEEAKETKEDKEESDSENKQEEESKEDTKEDTETEEQDETQPEENQEETQPEENQGEETQTTETENTDGNQETTEQTQVAGNEIPADFDAEFYAQTYPDVVQVFGDSPEVLYKHYLDYGQTEGRSKNGTEYATVHESSQN